MKRRAIELLFLYEQKPLEKEVIGALAQHRESDWFDAVADVFRMQEPVRPLISHSPRGSAKQRGQIFPGTRCHPQGERSYRLHDLLSVSPLSFLLPLPFLLSSSPGGKSILFVRVPHLSYIRVEG